MLQISGKEDIMSINDTCQRQHGVTQTFSVYPCHFSCLRLYSLYCFVSSGACEGIL